ncbi:MAG: hypothetical protein ACXU97_08980 [Thermodesulfobacteriota bacterium]
MKTMIVLVMLIMFSSTAFAQTLEDRIRILEETLKKQEQTIKELKGVQETLKKQEETINEQRKLIEDLKTEMKRVKTPEQQEVAQPKETAPPAGQEPQKTSTLDMLKGALLPKEGEPKRDILSYQVGGATMRLMDISFDGLFAAGASTARDDQLQILQNGDHDPRKRGFTVQNVELSFAGAVDPYFNAEAHIVYLIDPIIGDSRVELEEAFFTTQKLPYGLQLKGGQFVTEFGIINSQHPHQWDWQDAPIINTRLFGPDGMRGPGFRLGWLTPLPWYSEVYFGMQNANGETMASFFANKEFWQERPVGGRPFVDESVKSLQDLAYLARWINSWDLSNEVTMKLGFSAAYGPNPTGSNAQTWIYGSDLKLKWRPVNNFRGWPFILLQSEVMGRNYQAASFLSRGPDGIFGTGDDIRLPRETLKDWGFYSQLLWGFRNNWATGIRFEYVSGSGYDVDVNFGTGDVRYVSRNLDPFRNNRYRISPLLVWQLTEFSRFRLQYNYDHNQDRPIGFNHRDYHSVWFGAEIMLGAHAAHKY